MTTPASPVANAAADAVPPTPAALFAGLLAIFWIEYLRPGSFVPIFDAVKLNTIVPLAVATITIFARGGRPNPQVLRLPDMRLYLAILALFFLQFFIVDVRLYVFEAVKGFIGYLLLYYVIVRQVTTPRRLQSVMTTLVLVHVVTVVLYPNVILDPSTRHVLGGTFLGDGNDFAWSVALVLPFTLYLASASESKVAKIAFYAVFVVLIMAVIGTQSRGGTVGVLVSILYLAMMSRKRGAAFAGVAVVAAVVALFAPDTYFKRIDTISQWETEGSAQGRILAWKTAAAMALDHPLTGVGAGHYGVKFGFEYKPRGYHGPYLNTHSIYFVMLAEFGFPGLVILLAVLVGNFARNRRLLRRLRGRGPPATDASRRQLETMQASLLGYAVAGAFLSGVFYPHLFVLTALMASARAIVGRNIGRGETGSAPVQAPLQGLPGSLS